MGEAGKDPNYCHDPELRERAKGLGVMNAVNFALSIGEGLYNAFDRAEKFLIERAEKRRQQKLNRPKKTRLSKREKREIMKRNGL